MKKNHTIIIAATIIGLSMILSSIIDSYGYVASSIVMCESDYQIDEATVEVKVYTSL